MSAAIAVIDFETTGMTPAQGARATEVAIVLLEQGRVAADGTPDQVLTREHIERVYQQPVLVLRHPQRDVPLVVVADPSV
jgi:ABC-type hemin transport system ATPase subunit